MHQQPRQKIIFVCLIKTLSIKYIHKIYRKSTSAYMCVSGSKKCYFFGNFCIRTLWVAPNNVFVDSNLKAIILRIFREKSWFGLATSFKRKCIRKLILVNLVTQIFKNFSPVQTVVVPPGETNISKLLTAFFIFIRSPSLKVGSAALFH